jgi:hypothetical protein
MTERAVTIGWSVNSILRLAPGIFFRRPQSRPGHQALGQPRRIFVERIFVECARNLGSLSPLPSYPRKGDAREGGGP